MSDDEQGTGKFDPMGAGEAYPLSNKLERIVWRVVWFILARYSPPAMFGWRRFVLRVFGATIGNAARIYPSVKVWLPRHLTVGERALIGPGVRLYNQGQITIGARSVVSQHAHICASSHDVRDTNFMLVERPVHIGSACWIAAEAFVGPGVKIEDGAVLSARSVLFENAEGMGLYRGNPAVRIGTRTWRGGGQS